MARWPARPSTARRGATSSTSSAEHRLDTHGRQLAVGATAAASGGQHEYCARMIRSPTAVRGLFVSFGAFAGLLLVLALSSDSPERVALSAVAGAMAAASLLCALLAPRMVRWERRGGERRRG